MCGSHRIATVVASAETAYYLETQNRRLKAQPSRRTTLGTGNTRCMVILNRDKNTVATVHAVVRHAVAGAVAAVMNVAL